MLKFGGYINILIAVGHIVGLLWADWMFVVTGIANEMTELGQIHTSLPYLLTVFVAIVFFIFGLYGLSAAGKFRKLPFAKPLVFIIGGIYLIRGLGELIFDMEGQVAPPLTETIYSLIAVLIGLAFVLGGIKKWGLKKRSA